MSAFSLCVKETSDERVVIQFRVSGLESPFTKNNYDNILLTTENIIEGAVSAETNQKYITLGCGLYEGQTDVNYIEWEYDSAKYDSVNADDFDQREFHKRFEKDRKIRLYAYAKVAEGGGYWLIGNPIAFKVEAAICTAEFVSDTSYKIRAQVNYMPINSSNFVMCGYSIGGGTIQADDAPDEDKTSFGKKISGYKPGDEHTISFYVSTNDESDGEGQYWWCIGKASYCRGAKTIAGINIVPIDCGFKLSWDEYQGASYYKIYFTDNDDRTWEKKAAAGTTSIKIQWSETDTELIPYCETMKVYMVAYNTEGSAISSESYSSDGQKYWTVPPVQPVAELLSPEGYIMSGYQIILHQPYKESLVIWMTIEQPSGEAIRLEYKTPSSHNERITCYAAENVELQEDGIHTVRIRSEYNNIYCKDEDGNDYVYIKKIKTPRPLEWSWFSNNGSAGEEFTEAARLSIVYKRDTLTFNHLVWNDIINKCIEFLEYTDNADTKIGESLSEELYGNGGWSANNTYRQMLEKAKMDGENNTLYAYKYNILRYCIGSQPDNSTGISDKCKGDAVSGMELYNLADFYMNNIMSNWEGENLIVKGEN